MTSPWLVVLLVALLTGAFRAAGPALLGDRALSLRWSAVLTRTTPVILAALVATQTFAHDRHLVIDARAGGLLVAVVGASRRMSATVVLAAAVIVTAVLRLLFP
jgi:branched-subunit amino acid transport protein